ncbi:hypothetical protein Ait01nite_088350 [Actinoplanes italicus]|uniref:Uncharacterized protein n=1 Tax=Actinoplanes italicus TaxID=113567 RepID=A0A2T0JWK3_9ACTN|nr:hypothetical protein [Actinoplanes italicus]PRX12154.1 hypothetical protein CLV67_12911 [Actinoplanes italicus]GIE35790.1 hypothetical protein Ait01nite_088350 [Actinoplanes italicus]
MRTGPASVERREDWRAASILDSAPGLITVEFLDSLGQPARSRTDITLRAFGWEVAPTPDGPTFRSTP